MQQLDTSVRVRDNKQRAIPKSKAGNGKLQRCKGSFPVGTYWRDQAQQNAARNLNHRLPCAGDHWRVHIDMGTSNPRTASLDTSNTSSASNNKSE
jgi:hypothetical protein